LYYLWTGAYVLIALTPLVRHANVLAIEPDRWTIVPVYGFFLQNLVWIHTTTFRPPWLSALWSLALEEHFYLAAPWLIRYCSRRRLIQWLSMVVAVSPLIRAAALHYLAPAHKAAAYIPTPCRSDALAMGVLLAVVWRTESWRVWLQQHIGQVRIVVVVLSLAVAGLLLTGASEFDRAMAYWGFTCLDASLAGWLLLVLLAPDGIWGRLCRWRVLRQLGAVSYCVYLIHLEVLEVCLRLLSRMSAQPSAPAVAAATLLAAAATWGLATASWRYLESPMIRRGRRFSY
jgi:peptidoglycan/LPS O-acetylase OafA/YrhL